MGWYIFKMQSTNSYRAIKKLLTLSIQALNQGEFHPQK